MKTKFVLTLSVAMLALAVMACGVALFNTPGGAATGPNPTAQIPTPLPAEALGQADTQDEVLVNLYERVSPGVVSIEVSAKDNSGQLQDVGLGSGFVYDAEGHIITNEHVAAQADELRAVFTDGTVLPAKLVGGDQYADLAVLKIDAPAGFSLTPLEMGDSSTLKVGQRVVAIGNPFGLSNTMTQGIVSGIGRSLPSEQATTTQGVFSNPQIIQIDAAINPGNSGGPLLDLHGRVIGVNVAIRSTTGVNSGVGFAVPVNAVKRAVPQLIKTGKVVYPYLGVAADSNFSLGELALAFNLPVKEGVLISQVQSGSPADVAGLHGGNRTDTLRGQQVQLGGDIIVAIDGTPVNNFDELLGYLVSNTSPGQQIKVTIVRNGQKMDIPVTLGERPSS